jgi:hypothetical protein
LDLWVGVKLVAANERSLVGVPALPFVLAIFAVTEGLVIFSCRIAAIIKHLIALLLVRDVNSDSFGWLGKI